jgi:hypothetical protein
MLDRGSAHRFCPEFHGLSHSALQSRRQTDAAFLPAVFAQITPVVSRNSGP